MEEEDEMGAIDKLKVFAALDGNSDLFYADNRLAVSQDEAREILGRIAELEAKIPKWISAIDNPPSRDGKYLTKASDNHIETCRFGCGGWWNDHGRVWVSCWMPLSALPEVEK